MSLQLIAKQMEAKGRNGDSVLVHMTTGEVAGLQKLAETAGGSLSVNPETGLVEANYLKSILPTLVGAGVGFMTMNPMLGAAAGAAVGGIQARGSNQDMLTGMLMGGMGGYGGASLAGGITAAGAPAATGIGAGAAGTTAVPATQAMQQAALAQGAQVSGAEAAMLGTRTLPISAVPAGATVPASGIASAPVNFSDLTASQRMDQAMRGFTNLGTKEGRDIAYKNIGGSEGLIRAATFGMMPAANAAPTESAPQNIHPILSSKIDYRTPASRSVSAYQGGKPRSTSVPIPTFRAAQGGLMSLTEEGRPSFFAPQVTDNDPFANMPVYRDLEAYEGVMPNYVYQGKNIYTRAPVRQPRQVRAPAIPVITPAPVPVQPPVQVPTFTQPMMETGRGDGYTPNADFDTPEKQAAFYRDNPTMAGITQTFQRYNPFASLQEYMDPGFTERQGIIAAGLRPNQNFGVPGFDYTGDYDSFASERAAVDRARPGLVDGGLRDPQQRAEMAGIADAGTVTGGFDRDPQQRAEMARQAAEVGYNSTAGLSADSTPEGVTVGAAPDANLGRESIDSPGNDGVSEGRSSGGNSGGADSMAQGGLLGLAKGGMKQGGFVVPADVVSMVGEGNTDAGYRRIMALLPGATPIRGKDGGQSDTVKTNIEGKQPARVAHGEMYIPPEVVKKAGGAKKLYAMMDKVRQQATGSKKQIKPVSLERAMA